MNGMTKEDSGTIGFVTSCLFAQALDISEFQKWVAHVLETETTPTPGYLIELSEFSGPLYQIYKAIGFVPHWPYSEDERLALFGIAFKRGRQPFDCPLDRPTAAQKLKQYPHLEERFCSTFPFLGCP